MGFIEDHTGTSHATISRCLKTLREERLIKLVETDYKRGNIWSISPIAFAGCDPENVPPRSGGPQNEGPGNKAEAHSKRDPFSLNLREKPPQIEGEIRKIKKDKKLSQEGAQALLERIEAIRAPEKQKTEREGLMKLLETHDPSEIEIALTHIKRYGTLSGENCHSPFRYLTIAMDDVLKVCHQKRLSLTTNARGVILITQHRDEQNETEQKHLAIAAFHNELTSQERTKLVDEYIAKECISGFKPSEKLLTRLVAWRWYSDKMSIQENFAS